MDSLKIVLLFAMAQHLRIGRALTFPEGAATGILAAIAIPLNLPERECFVSYNIEANYGMPIEASDIIPGKLKRLDPPAEDENEGRDIFISGNETEILDRDEEWKRQRRQTSLITRQKFYTLLTRKLNSMNLNGKACLLKLVCESSHYSLREHNGWLGDLVHVLLSPSSSKSESVHPEYYKAEEYGKNTYKDCRKYKKLCPDDILGEITKFV